MTPKSIGSSTENYYQVESDLENLTTWTEISTSYLSALILKSTCMCLFGYRPTVFKQ